MRRHTTQGLFACVLVASGASCSLLTSFDGFTGRTNPDSGDAGNPVRDASGTDVSALDVAADISSLLDSPASLSYRATILADAPLAYWRFGEASGTMAGDETGHGNVAMLGTGVTWGAAGALLNDTNTAAHLAGTQCLNAGYSFDFPGNDPYSLEAWVYVDMPVDKSFRHLFVKDDETQATGREDYGIYMEVDDGMAFERYVRGAGVRAFAPAPALDQWTYVVAAYDGTQLSLYSNGALVMRAPDTRAQASKNAPEYLGCKNFNYVSVQGSLDEYAIYGYALSDAQAAAHWKASGR